MAELALSASFENLCYGSTYTINILHSQCRGRRTLMTSRGSDTVTSIFKWDSAKTITKLPAENGLVFIGT